MDQRVLSRVKSFSEYSLRMLRKLHLTLPVLDPMIRGSVHLAERLLPQYATYIEIRSKTEIFRESAVDFADIDVCEIDRPIGSDHPLVTVIVPNYNHSQYLEQRLESIYHQTYDNYEVILMDDCSTDNSREILTSYSEKYPEITRCIFNEQNSGHVFSQWNKGLSNAKGELIWIAESDDWCDHSFLETLVPFFTRQSVMIAYSRSSFMKNGEVYSDTERYLSDTDLDAGSESILTSNAAVLKGFGYRNIIPNVSSSVFRNIGQIPNEVTDLWKNLKLCGDWLFYLSVAKGGCIAYSPKTTNYYRLHDKSTSLKIQHTNQYFSEVYSVSEYISKNYKVDSELFEKVLDHLKIHYMEHSMGSDPSEVDSLYDLEKLKGNLKNRYPHVLMCGYSMKIGGGEIFPIHLANALKKLGVSVTFIDFNMDTYNPEVRSKLDRAIPMIELVSPSKIPELLALMNADIIHSHHGSVDQLISLFVGNTHYSQVVTLHGMYETMTKAELTNFLPQIVTTCERFFYISDKNLVPFVDNGLYDTEKFKKVDNGLESKKNHVLSRTNLGIPEGAFVCCLVSRARFDKGWVEAAEAVVELNKSSSREIHLILVGDGEAVDAVRNIDSEYIHVMGFQSDPQAFFSISDTGLLPSYFAGESFPLTIIECLFEGKPVIASDIGEIPDMLSVSSEERGGILISMKKGETAEIIHAISQLCSDEEEYIHLSRNACLLKERFDIMTVCKSYLLEYESLFGSNSQ